MANQTPKMIVVHISDRNPQTGEVFKSAREVDRFHRDVRGWAEIGYHYTIDANGVVEKGRHDRITGAHVKGHNQDSLGICLLAVDGLFTLPQIDALVYLIRRLQAQWAIPLEQVTTHNEFTNEKSCPDFSRGALLSLLGR